MTVYSASIFVNMIPQLACKCACICAVVYCCIIKDVFLEEYKTKVGFSGKRKAHTKSQEVKKVSIDK